MIVKSESQVLEVNRWLQLTDDCCCFSGDYAWFRSRSYADFDVEELGNVFESVMDGLSGHLSILTDKQMGNLGQSQSVGEAI